MFPAKGTYTTSPLQVVSYGAGCIETALPDILAKFGTKKAFILTGSSLSKTALVPRLRSLLGEKYVGMNTGIGQHAPIAGIKAASKDVDASGADTIVAFGGGSPIDSAKAIKYWLHEEGKPWLKIIAVPTTLSNAETTMNAGFTTEEGHKDRVSHYELCPNAIIYDAELTLETPERLWLSTGMRSVDHAVETLYRPNVPPPVLVTALSSLPLLFKNLAASKSDPRSLPAREQLQIASWLSLFPDPKPGAVGLSHGLGHALGATYAIPHGITSCLTLAGSVARVARRTKPEFQAMLSEALRLVEPSVPDLAPPTGRFSKPDDAALPQAAQDGVKLAGYIDALVDRLGLHSRLRDYKIEENDFEDIVRNGHADKHPDVSKAEVMEIMKEIW